MCEIGPRRAGGVSRPPPHFLLAASGRGRVGYKGFCLLQKDVAVLITCDSDNKYSWLELQRAADNCIPHPWPSCDASACSLWAGKRAGQEGGEPGAPPLPQLCSSLSRPGENEGARWLSMATALKSCNSFL